MKNLLKKITIVMMLAFSVMLFGASVSAAAATDAAPAVENAVIDNAAAEDDGYVIADTASSSSEKKDVNWVKVILISVGIGLVVSVVTVLVIRSGYKNNGKTEPYQFNNKAPLDLREKEDVLIDVRVTSVQIHRDND